MKTHPILRFCRLSLALGTFFALLWCMGACSSSDESWEQVPQPITEFVNKYFPFEKLLSYSDSSGQYRLRLADGPGLTFDKTYAWTAVDGYGMPLPQVLLFDQLPPKLYDYIQSLEALNGVFSIERNAAYYLVTLLDSTVKFTVDTAEITTV